MRGWQAGSITGAVAVGLLVLRFAPSRIGLPVLAAVLVVGAGLAWRTRDREHHLRAWTRSTGWVWWGGDDQSLAEMSHHYPFSGPRTVSEVMRGTYGGREAASFVVHVGGREGGSLASGLGGLGGSVLGTGLGALDETAAVSGLGRQQVSFHVVAVRLPMWLPMVDVVPETFGVKVEKATGAQDLQFESDQFNRAYRVQARDERAAYALIQPVLMERLLRDDARGIAWRTDGTWVLSWQSGATDLDSLLRRLGLLSAVAASIRPHVFQQYGIDTAGWDPTAPPTATL